MPGACPCASSARSHTPSCWRAWRPPLGRGRFAERADPGGRPGRRAGFADRAMAAGVPVVSTASRRDPRAGDRGRGILVPPRRSGGPRDALERLKDPRFGKACRLRTAAESRREFDVERIAPSSPRVSPRASRRQSRRIRPGRSSRFARAGAGRARGRRRLAANAPAARPSAGASGPSLCQTPVRGHANAEARRKLVGSPQPASVVPPRRPRQSHAHRPRRTGTRSSSTAARARPRFAPRPCELFGQHRIVERRQPRMGAAVGADLPARRPEGAAARPNRAGGARPRTGPLAHRSTPRQLSGSSLRPGRSGTKTVPAARAGSRSGNARSSTERRPSSKVTATVLRCGGAVAACAKVAPR